MAKRRRKKKKKKNNAPQKSLSGQKRKKPRKGKRILLKPVAALLIICGSIYVYKRSQNVEPIKESPKLVKLSMSEDMVKFIEETADLADVQKVLNMDSIIEAQAHIQSECFPVDFQKLDRHYEENVAQLIKEHPHVTQDRVYRRQTPFDTAYKDVTDDHRLAAMSDFIFRREHIDYDEAAGSHAFLVSSLAFGQENDPRHRLGNCLSMPQYHLGYAEKLGWNMKIFWMPNHSMLRFIRGSSYINCECTSGKWRTDEDLMSDERVTQKAVENGIYMKTLGLNAAKSALYLMNYLYFKSSKAGKPQTQIRRLANALLLNSKCSHSIALMARELMKVGRIDLANKFIQHARDLGIRTDIEENMLASIQNYSRMVHRGLPDEDYFRRQQERLRRRNQATYPQYPRGFDPLPQVPGKPNRRNPYLPPDPRHPIPGQNGGR